MDHCLRYVLISFCVGTTKKGKQMKTEAIFPNGSTPKMVRVTNALAAAGGTYECNSGGLHGVGVDGTSLPKQARDFGFVKLPNKYF